MHSGERYSCSLSDELLRKAAEELNEPTDNDVRLAEIDKLRTRFMEEDNGMELIRSDDAFLLRFLRVRKFDQDRAYQCLYNYHKQRQTWPEVFERVNQPSQISNFLNCGSILSLGQIAKDKTFVVYALPGLNWDDSMTINDFFAAIALTFEKLLENEEFQIRGITWIDNMAHFSVSLAMHMAASGKQLLFFIQDAMPIRLKQVHVVNEALVFDMLYSLWSVFMKDKIKKRIQVHGSDFTKLHEAVPCHLLPKSLGGTARDIDPQTWKNEILSSMGEGEETAL